MRTTFGVTVRLLALGLLLSLTACGTTTGLSESRQALCDQFQPIRWADADTDATIRQAKEHNAVFLKICRWKP